MKFLKYLISGFLLLTALSSCKKDANITPSGTGTYTLNFSLTASGTPLAMEQIVTNVNTRYYFSILRFYLGFAKLVKTDGTEVSLADIKIVKFDNGIQDNAVCGKSFSFNVPAGSYKGIKFGIGVPPAIKDTVNHYHNNPLDPLNSDYGLLWTMTSNGKINVFRNIGINLMADTSQAQNQTPKRFLSFHILEDDTTLNLYKALYFSDVFTINSGQNHRSQFNLDANQVFFNPTNAIDLRKAVSTDMVKTDKTGIALGLKITSNFSSAISKQ